MYNTYRILERTETCHENFKKSWKEKDANIIKTLWRISFNINAITIRAVEWRRSRLLSYIAQKILIYFYNLDKLLSKLLKI